MERARSSDRGPAVVPTRGDRADPEALRRAAGVLGAGGLVALPTDTVYGVVADPLSETAVERIYEAKGRDRLKPLAALAADVAAAWALCAEVSDAARRLADSFWPGALTIVVPAGDACPLSLAGVDGYVGLRVPRHPFVRELCGALDGALASTSANPSGGPDPLSADAVAETLGASVDLIVDGGPCRCASPSTVVRLEPGRIDILREGAVSRRALEWALTDAPQRVRSILFVCTANICRSPYAELRLAHLLGRLGIEGVSVSSAGIMATGGRPMYPGMALPLAERGGDASGHHSRLIDAEMAGRADLILCMEGEQQEIVSRAFPRAAGRAFRLAAFLGLGSDVIDPVLDTSGTCRGVADRIDTCVEILAERLCAWRREQ